MVSYQNGGIMSLSKREQDRLEAALADRAVKEKILDEIQAMRDAYNALLAKLDADAGVTDVDYESVLEIEAIREDDKKTKL
jgi:hypothetical protein